MPTDQTTPAAPERDRFFIVLPNGEASELERLPSKPGEVILVARDARQVWPSADVKDRRIAALESALAASVPREVAVELMAKMLPSGIRRIMDMVTMSDLRRDTPHVITVASDLLARAEAEAKAKEAAGK